MASSTNTLTAESTTVHDARHPVTSDTPNPDEPPSPTSLRPSLSWKSFRSSISLPEKASANLGWAIALLSVLFTIVSLSPAFRSQGMSERALKLAEWTALKDFIEECREELAAGVQSQVCLRAMDAKLPPPPYIQSGILDRVRRNLMHVTVEHNGTISIPEVGHRDLGRPGRIQDVFAGSVIVIACISIFIAFRTRRVKHRPQILRTESKDEELLSPTPPPTTTPTIRHPPTHPLNPNTLRRRRPIRSHPIYTHSSLESAFHHSDLTEIRLRLQNGEDVNDHWPYLIYKLAITPPSIDTPKRLEIARLCLDFGADVNALKGWNGQSALMIAIHFGNVDVAKLLIVNGATVGYSPRDSNLTALHRCVRLAVTGVSKDALEIMKLLFEYGAEPNQMDRTGETALHKLLIDAWWRRDRPTVMKKLEPVALCLVDHGADLPKSIKEKYVEGNPLWEIAWRAIWRREDERRLGNGSLSREPMIMIDDIM
ncbi:ankyrin [Byssothecium circinans]|uniref:Ankyrin n=1 Tax=Byssothecium circinans TaxID=147558 RepID=A0A6A5U5J8_9PLEO|nr:ankyrin [Byssothecium circinans]